MDIVASLSLSLIKLCVVLSAIAVSASSVGTAPAAASEGNSHDDPGAVVAFIPNRPGDLKLLDEARSLGGFAIGLASPSIGRDVPAVQTYLDLGQGASVNYTLYGPLPTNPAQFMRFGRGIKSATFAALKKRAEDVPATIRPGLLASTLKRSGIKVAYAYSSDAVNGARGTPQALAAMDRGGVVREVGRVSEIRSLLQRNRTVIAWLPADQVKTLSGLVAEDDLLVLIGVPQSTENRNHMLPVAVRGLSSDGTLSSATTRTKGLITIPDIAANIIDRFAIDKPDVFQGAKFELDPAESVDTLEELDGRLSVIEARRLPALAILIGAALLMVSLLFIVLGRRGLWLGIRIAALALFWLPLVLLLVAAMNLSAGWEYALNVCVALVLSIVSVLLLPVRVAPIVAIGVSLAAIVIDLTLGSQLIQVSLLGPNPVFGARFFGIGNELAGLLAASFLLGAGLTVDVAGTKNRSLAILIMGGVFAFILGWTHLGADVGGVVVVVMGSVVAAVLIAEKKLSGRWVLLAVAAAALVLAVVVAADLITGGGSHLTEQLTGSSGVGGVGLTITRRLELAYRSLTDPVVLILTVVAFALLAVGFKQRKALLQPLKDHRWAGTRAGIAAALVATVVGFFINDSGPILLFGGAAEIVLFIGYIWATPNQWNQEKGLRAP